MPALRCNAGYAAMLTPDVHDSTFTNAAARLVIIDARYPSGKLLGNDPRLNQTSSLVSVR